MQTRMNGRRGSHDFASTQRAHQFWSTLSPRPFTQRTLKFLYEVMNTFASVIVSFIITPLTRAASGSETGRVESHQKSSG